MYFQNLDASRFYAFLIVFLAHCFVTSDPGIRQHEVYAAVYNWGKVGILGLEYFFVLSSFLISYIILEEKAQTGNFHFSFFLVRRSLRVWPLYFLVVAIGFLVIFIAHRTNVQVGPLPPWPYLMLFLVNFYIIENGTGFLFFIAFLWSISVEEQFYLLWSIFMKWVGINFIWFCIFLIMISVFFRIYFLGNDPHLFFHTLSALANFGIGGLLAYGMFHGNNLLIRISRLQVGSVFIIYLLFGLSFIFYHQLMEYQLFRVLERLYFSVFFAYIILDQTIGENRLFNLEKPTHFRYLGKISYGLYCFHGIVITLLLKVMEHSNLPQNLLLVLLVYPLVILAVTVLISRISYRYFESYFLQLKNSFYTFRK